MIDERCVRSEGSGILYDASTLRKPHDDIFSRDYWRARNALSEVAGGRGSVALLHSEEGDWVLRHYRRGGWAAKVSRDGYVWMGADRTRCFREWRLLAELYRRGLPVPRPIGARFARRGLLYRADLITERLAGVTTLADATTRAPLSQAHWRAVGGTIARFHHHGVQHADLNAHNILLTDLPQTSTVPQVYLLDFDQGRLRSRGAWEESVLARLRRSLDKVRRQYPGAHFGDEAWRWLLEGYRV
jgi:3-deoxy-D-manno-octulosonic acid kinase